MSSFYTSLSGLNAAQTDLNVTSNNIANVGTNGFKSSNVEFADVISSSLYQAGNSVVGQGTRTKSISQEFTQGSVQSTGQSLDLMVNDQGFFVTKAAGTGSQVNFTRDGAFKLNANTDNVTDSAGNELQVLPVDQLGNVTATGSAAMRTLHVPETNGTAKATSEIDLSMTFPSDAAAPTDTTFSPTDAKSYNGATSTTVYDSAGNAIPATVYYVHTQSLTTNSDGTKSGTSQWVAHTYVGDQEVFPAGTTTAPTLTFDTNGTLTSPTGVQTYGAVTPTGASGPLAISFNYGTATQEGAFALQTVQSSQNGNTVGQLSDLTVGDDGVVSATYSDGSSLKLGAVALANFTNPSGLHQSGSTNWQATGASGAAQIGAAGTNGLGTVSQGELEMSNVDLTSELVNLISAQRDFQANSKAIDTDKQMLESIIQVV
ncbi:flagellar hook protein FlgE [Sphingomonas abietis]|uniref:Flagellar hook protein FlgE n=1 Tax=Sphingomonas abietis TaxID=3012344 RepID=A0ABY7NKS3_9SPHN|nr:flagellar hook protein FlgE [Sphingomonas abietis]WBO22135.1 flagellar hook protein FlgE [Sphingomonas abietis]